MITNTEDTKSIGESLKNYAFELYVREHNHINEKYKYWKLLGHLIKLAESQESLIEELSAQIHSLLIAKNAYLAEYTTKFEQLSQEKQQLSQELETYQMQMDEINNHLSNL